MDGPQVMTRDGCNSSIPIAAANLYLSAHRLIVGEWEGRLTTDSRALKAKEDPDAAYGARDNMAQGGNRSWES